MLTLISTLYKRSSESGGDATAFRIRWKASGRIFKPLGWFWQHARQNDLCVSHYAAHTEEVSSSNPVSRMLITLTAKTECSPG